MLATMRKNLEDKDLLKAWIGGDAGAFRALYGKYGSKLYGFLYYLSGSEEEAGDALQGLFLRLVRKAPQFAAADDVERYLFAAARREWLGQRRRAGKGVQPSRLSEAQARALPDGREDPAGGGGREALETLMKLLERLPADQRDTVVLHLQQGLTFADIAVLQKCPPKTVASRYYLAVEKLRALADKRLLNKDNPDEA